MNKIISENPAKTATSTNTEPTPTLPLENQPRPKKRYLTSNEILTLLQNSNRTYATEILPCPLTKQGEET